MSQKHPFAIPQLGPVGPSINTPGPMYSMNGPIGGTGPMGPVHRFEFISDQIPFITECSAKIRMHGNSNHANIDMVFSYEANVIRTEKRSIATINQRGIFILNRGDSGDQTSFEEASPVDPGYLVDSREIMTGASVEEMFCMAILPKSYGMKPDFQKTLKDPFWKDLLRTIEVEFATHSIHEQLDVKYSR